MTSHIICFGECFILATAYFLSKCLPACNEVYTAAWCICQKQDLARVSFSSSLVSGVALVPALWDFDANYLLKLLETVLELSALAFKRKIARIFKVFRGRPDLALS